MEATDRAERVEPELFLRGTQAPHRKVREQENRALAVVLHQNPSRQSFLYIILTN
jgi:hypothetical protein